MCDIDSVSIVVVDDGTCQFVELKGSVFKKFEKHNLFQMTCSDVRERFHLLFLLTVVGVRNLTEFSWNLGQSLHFTPLDTGQCGHWTVDCGHWTVDSGQWTVDTHCRMNTHSCCTNSTCSLSVLFCTELC